MRYSCRTQHSMSQKASTSVKAPSGTGGVYTLHNVRDVTVASLYSARPSGVPARSKAGVLLKCGGSVRTWKKRFFVLSQKAPALYYYSKNTDKRVLGFIPLWDTVLEVSDQRPNLLVVSHKCRRPYPFQAPDAGTFEEWQIAITDAQTSFYQRSWAECDAFWKVAWGPEVDRVPWAAFAQKLAVHVGAPDGVLEEETAVRLRYVFSTMDEDPDLSTVTLDQVHRFVLTFGKLKRAWNMFNAVLKFYCGRMTPPEAAELVMGGKPGTFVVRSVSHGKLHVTLVTTYMSKKRRVKHRAVFRDPSHNLWYYDAERQALPEFGHVVAEMIGSRRLIGRNSPEKKQMLEQLSAMMKEEALAPQPNPSPLTGSEESGPGQSSSLEDATDVTDMTDMTDVTDSRGSFVSWGGHDDESDHMMSTQMDNLLGSLTQAAEAERGASPAPTDASPASPDAQDPDLDTIEGEMDSLLAQLGLGPLDGVDADANSGDFDSSDDDGEESVAQPDGGAASPKRNKRRSYYNLTDFEFDSDLDSPILPGEGAGEEVERFCGSCGTAREGGVMQCSNCGAKYATSSVPGAGKKANRDYSMSLSMGSYPLDSSEDASAKAGREPDAGAVVNADAADADSGTSVDSDSNTGASTKVDGDALSANTGSRSSILDEPQGDEDGLELGDDVGSMDNLTLQDALDVEPSVAIARLSDRRSAAKRMTPAQRREAVDKDAELAALLNTDYDFDDEPKAE